jgi:rhamnulokinase
MGLWLLQESLRTWQEAGQPADQYFLLAEAARLPPGGPVVDVDAGEFIPPGDMPARIRAACEAAGQPSPHTSPAVVRCILDSLANAYARTVAEAGRLSGHPADVIHIVGGGCQNELLCQLTADLSGLPVLAGPVEATALGNVAVQARAAGRAPGTLESLRSALGRGMTLQRYQPASAAASVAAEVD